MNLPHISARNLTVGYGDSPIFENLQVDIPKGQITTLIGPNGCGKSTLLKALSGLLDYRGTVEVAGRPLEKLKRNERARTISMLPQAPQAPDGLTVSALVARGRHPYQSWMSQWSTRDEAEVYKALEATDLLDFADRQLSSLSGGQAQRVWIAMALAQQTPIMLLDEPTTYLDLSYSIEVLKLVRRFNREQGKTVVMVLHDLNLAVRYSDHLIAMGYGGVVEDGAPGELMTEELLAEVFGLEALVVEDPVSGGPLIVPR